MPKKTMIAVIDTETASLMGGVYDFAYAITDKKGNIEKTENHLVEEIVTNGSMMMGAFYAKKTFSHYFPMLDNDLIDLWAWSDIRDQFLQDLIDYDVSIIAAYNLPFDARVLAATHNSITKQEKFLHGKYKMLDIWRFSCLTILNRRGYKNLAHEKGWVSDAGNIRTNAECAYRYAANDNEFIEHHTALHDVIAENKILAYCFRQKKKTPFGLTGVAPWRIVNN